MQQASSIRRMGVVVIGQSPRPAMRAEIAAVLSPGWSIELRGALDGMSRAEIDAIPPRRRRRRAVHPAA